ERVVKDEKEDGAGDQHDLRFEADTEGDHEERRQRDLRQGIECGDDGRGYALDTRQEAETKPASDGERSTDDIAQHHLGQGGGDVTEERVIRDPAREHGDDRRRAADPKFWNDGARHPFPGCEEDDERRGADDRRAERPRHEGAPTARRTPGRRHPQRRHGAAHRSVPFATSSLSSFHSSSWRRAKSSLKRRRKASRGCASGISRSVLMRPGRPVKTTTRSARVIASPRSWVTKTTVIRRSRVRRRSS